MTADDLKPGTKVIHKKGGRYQIVGVGKHSETLENLVVYRNAKDDIWIRPLEMFIDGRFILDKEEK